MKTEKQTFSLDKFIKTYYRNSNGEYENFGAQDRKIQASNEYNYAKKVFKYLDKQLKKIEKHPKKFEVDFKVDNDYSNFAYFVTVSSMEGYTRAAKAMLENVPSIYKNDLRDRDHSKRVNFAWDQPATRKKIEDHAKNKKVRKELLSLYDYKYSKYEKQHDEKMESTNNKTVKKAKNNAKAKETVENKDQGLEA